MQLSHRLKRCTNQHPPNLSRFPVSTGRILVIEEDCGRLASLLLWLGHYDDFEVKGTVFDQNKDFSKLSSFNADVILINDASFYASDAVKNLKQTIDLCLGRVIVRTPSSTSGEQLSLMKDEKRFVAQFSDRTPLGELKEKIEQLLSANEASPRMIMAKAG